MVVLQENVFLKDLVLLIGMNLIPEVVDVCNKHLGDIGNKSTEKNSVKCVWGDAFESIKSVER